MAALAQDYRQPEPFEVPEGGLASFLTATTGEWAEATNDDHIPETGIAGVKAVADKLAEYGRYEDEYMVHAAEGETVIPAQVLDLNPRLKAKLFKEMRDMGLEPERYVVGNELNSINPVTGQPEFFLKKLFKGIKKAVKKVVKVLKKASTVVLPIVGAMMGGPLGAALGSGIATAIQGGNLKDILKSAAISGLTAGVFQAGQAGFQAASAGSATGLGNVGEFLSGAGQNISSGLSGGYTDQFGQMVASLGGGASSAGIEESILQPEQISSSADPAGALPPGTEQVASSTGIEFGPAGGMPTTAQELGTAPDISASLLQPEQVSGMTAAGQPIPQGVDPASLNIASTPTVGAPDLLGTAGQSFSETTANLLKPEGLGDFFSNAKEFFMPTDINDVIARLKDLPQYAGKTAPELEQIAREMLVNAGRTTAEAGLMRTYGPALVGGMGLLAATGGFETPEFEPVEPFGGQTGYDLRQQFPGLYDPGVYRYAPVRTAAGGGDITHFPRRNGAIYGPGTETSDDIPAMLSDGEFVMTARAVRGAGDGDRERGMQRMYDIMRRFEGGAIRG